MLVDHANKVAFCEKNKSGSSTGVAMMIKYGPHGNLAPDSYAKGQVHQFSLKNKLGLSYELYTDKLKKYTKLMIVRHPFDRLLSTYGDKMNTIDKSPRFKQLRLLIDTEYGDKNYSKFEVGGFADIPDKNVTFRKFMDMLLDVNNRVKDEHWESFGLKCDPC